VRGRPVPTGRRQLTPRHPPHPGHRSRRAPGRADPPRPARPRPGRRPASGSSPPPAETPSWTRRSPPATAPQGSATTRPPGLGPRRCCATRRGSRGRRWGSGCRPASALPDRPRAGATSDTGIVRGARRSQTMAGAIARRGLGGGGRRLVERNWLGVEGQARGDQQEHQSGRRRAAPAVAEGAAGWRTMSGRPYVPAARRRSRSSSLRRGQLRQGEAEAIV